MPELIIPIIKLAAKASFLLAIIITFVALMISILGGVSVVVNATLIGEVLAFIQMWLPFNLSVLMLWLVTITSLLVAYKLAYFAYGLISDFVGDRN